MNDPQPIPKNLPAALLLAAAFVWMAPLAGHAAPQHYFVHTTIVAAGRGLAACDARQRPAARASLGGVIDEEDLHTDTFSNARGWSAVRVTHAPSGTVAGRDR